ncbi:hypothetical protein BDV93DRAFT_551271 [Ceratobasidium sp. AG-I]|nr:hypothetical protein BDV93DRAFT_551271 [Ceratobasidium sp. AG-I]
MKFSAIVSATLLAAVAQAASPFARRASEITETYADLTVRTPEGLELTARDTSPAKLNELLGRVCCTVCIPKGSDNCNCCGWCC